MQITQEQDRQELAAYGGTPARTTPLPSVGDLSGRRIDEAEIEAVTRVLRSGKLNSTVGSETAGWESDFAAFLGVEHAVACSSGTAALHLAVAAVNPEPGEEIILTGLSDAGTMLPILAQNAVPVFADVDLRAGNLDPASAAEKITGKTRAIIAVHLFGIPAAVDELRALAGQHHLILIEDCAQAYLTQTASGALAGTTGQLGCFSLQQSKHITAGDGGTVVSNDVALARRARLFADKAWPRDAPTSATQHAGSFERTHLFLGLNYRMTELQSSIARVQLTKLETIVADRRRNAARLTHKLTGLAGLQCAPEDGTAYWLFPLYLDPELAGADAFGYAELLRPEGIAGVPGYIQRPLYCTPVLTGHHTYGTSGYPIADHEYGEGLCPNTEALIGGRLLTLQWNENYTDADVDDIAEAITKVHAYLTR